jgi:hypothetical protein
VTKVADWVPIDRQMQPWGTRLRDDLGLSALQAGELASCISKEVAALTPSQRDQLRLMSPIPASYRLAELTAFQAWMDIARGAPHPAVTRAQVITQNYVCFVYLKESWFEVLHQVMSPNTATVACCAFLLSEPLHRFRNAFAHGNWRYLSDFSGLEFWARVKGRGTTEVRSEVLQLELDFWQALSRCTAYASLLTLADTAA